MGILTGIFQNEYPYTDLHELNLSWVITQTKTVLDAVKQIDGWIENHEKEYQELEKIVSDIEAGILPDSVYDKLKLWFIANYKDILGEFIKFISFRLNDEGYLVVSIPEGLQELVFNTTGLDITTPLEPQYGHLTLSY